MLSETRKKEIKILRNLMMYDGDMKKVVEGSGFKERDYYRFIQKMKAKGIYPNIDFRKNKDYVKNELSKFPFELIIRYLYAVDSDNFIFNESSAYDIIRKSEIANYVAYFEKIYKCKASEGIVAAITYCYDYLEKRGIGKNVLVKTIDKIISKRNMKYNKIKSIFKTELKKENKKNNKTEEDNNKDNKDKVVVEEINNNEIKVIKKNIKDDKEFNTIRSKISEDIIKQCKEKFYFPNELRKEMSDELIEFYKEWDKTLCKIGKREVLGLEAIYKSLKDRKLPALEWFKEGYKIVYRKTLTGSITDKEKTVAYFVRMMRNWEAYGKGFSGRWQDKLLFLKLEEKLKSKLTIEQINKVHRLMGMYGILPLYIAVAECDCIVRDIDYYLDVYLPIQINKLKNVVND